MEQEEKINIEETSINLGLVKKEFENEEPEFQENQYKIASNFENITQKISEQRKNRDNLIDFLDADAIMKTETVELGVKEENKDIIQETIEQSHMEIIQRHCCKIWFEKWDHLENHIDEDYNRLYHNKVDTQQKLTDEIEETQGNGEISTAIDDNRSYLTRTETIDSKYADGICKACKEESFGEKKHKCPECSYQSNHKICPKLHILNRHSNTNEKKYKCSECSYQTDHKGHLRTHLNIHNSRTFECDMCKKKFTQKSSLNKHVSEQHSNTNEKKYKCGECPYQTNVEDRLSKHINIHIKPFKCDICKKTFTMECNLKKHIRDQHSNTNEKKYKCTKCSYQTNRKDNFITHLNRHYNIKPFECGICKKRFTLKGSLKTHIEDKHSNLNEKYKCSECSYQTDCKSNLKAHHNRH